LPWYSSAPPSAAAPAGQTFSEISETVTDLTNAIIRCSDYDPASCPSHYSHLIGPAKVDVPLAAARSLMVDPEADEFSAVPQLNDDSPGDHGAQAALLALDVLGRPLLLDGGKSLPQDEVLAINKAIAEGTLAERLIVLGWISDTWRLLISLPGDKFTAAWTANINNLLLSKGRRVKQRTLETMVGRLQCVANIMIQGNHFLGRLRSAVLRANKFKGTRLSSEEIKDLVLWKDLLVVAHTGINLYLLTTQEPNNILRTNACEHGFWRLLAQNGSGLALGDSFASPRAQVDQLPRVPGVRGRDYAEHRGGRSSS